MLLRNFVSSLLITFSLVNSAFSAELSPEVPRIAVTDLSFEDSVREHFYTASSKQKTSLQSNFTDRGNKTVSSNSPTSGTSDRPISPIRISESPELGPDNLQNIRTSGNEHSTSNNSTSSLTSENTMSTSGDSTSKNSSIKVQANSNNSQNNRNSINTQPQSDNSVGNKNSQNDFSKSDNSQDTQSSLNAESEFNYSEKSGIETKITRGELRKFVSDVKGEMLKSGYYRVFQGKSLNKKDTDDLFDIISRIKEGYFKGADYVLFGMVNSIEFRDENSIIMGSDTVSHILSLELVADFNLIDTETYEIKAAFSAMGEGKDVKLISTSRGGKVAPNRGKVISDVSKSLGRDVARQLEEQFNPSVLSKNSARSLGGRGESEGQVIIYKDEPLLSSP